MSRRFSIACLVLLVLAPLARAGDEKSFKVPFDTLQTQHMVIMVKINGKGPYRMIFDTGSPMTLINNRVAKDSGVMAKDALPAISLFAIPEKTIKTLEIGDVKLTDFKTVVMDHPTVSLIDKFLGPVEGLVGLTFFAKYKMTIDYQAKEMTFVPVHFTPPDATKGMMALLLNPGKNKKVLAPAGQWGFSVAKDANDEEAGVTVKEVFDGSPAAAAGLKAGDRLLTIEGRWTDSAADCYQAAVFARPGSSAKIVVRRDGKEIELTVKVAAGVNVPVLSGGALIAVSRLMRIKTLLCAVTFVLLTVVTSASNQNKSTPTKVASSQAEINKLIRELGDDSFKVREKAATQLSGIGQAALEMLQEAEKKGDSLEIRSQAAKLVKDICIAGRLPARVSEAEFKTLFVDKEWALPNDGSGKFFDIVLEIKNTADLPVCFSFKRGGLKLTFTDSKGENLLQSFGNDRAYQPVISPAVSKNACFSLTFKCCLAPSNGVLLIVRDPLNDEWSSQILPRGDYKLAVTYSNDKLESVSGESLWQGRVETLAETIKIK